MRHPAIVLLCLFALFLIGGTLFGISGNAPDATAACAGTDVAECLADRYERLGEEKGTLAALATLHRSIERDASLAGVCHEAMHRIGHRALREFGGIAEAYAKGNFDCGNGYYHGVIEAYAALHESALVTDNGVRSLCEGFASSSREAENCVHGEGHALFSQRSGSLPSALRSCATFASDRFVAECAAGAFMEAALSRLTLAESSDPLRNPTLVCASMPGDQYPCYLALAALVEGRSAEKGASSTSYCELLRDDAYRASCTHPERIVSPAFGALMLDPSASKFLGE
jgi:hypothetical protein